MAREEIMKITYLGTLCACALTLVVSTSTNAALVSVLGGQAINDTDLNITWLANANLAATNTFGVSGINADGSMYWDIAQNWISAMNSANYLGYNDWRLPSTLQPDPSCDTQYNGDSFGYTCTGSEMGHLFYNELGGVADSSITSTHNANYDLFSNIQSSIYSHAYWSGVYTPFTNAAWWFHFGLGLMDSQWKLNDNYVIAVREGQVSVVPLPTAAWLFTSGLLGLMGVARRHRVT